MATRHNPIAEEIRALLTESEAVSPGPWREVHDRVDDGNGDLVCRDMLRVDRRLVVAIRNALPEILHLLTTAEAIRDPGQSQPGTIAQAQSREGPGGSSLAPTEVD